MASAPATAEEASAQQSADGYFSALVPAKYVLVTTFKWGRTPVSSPVRMVVRGWSALVEDMLLSWLDDSRGLSRAQLVEMMAVALPSLGRIVSPTR